MNKYINIIIIIIIIKLNDKLLQFKLIIYILIFFIIFIKEIYETFIILLYFLYFYYFIKEISRILLHKKIVNYISIWNYLIFISVIFFHTIY